MKLTDVSTVEELRDLMTTPTAGLVECIRRLDGDFAVLGAGGKMGPELVETLVRARRRAGVDCRIAAASRFSDPNARTRLEELGVEIYAGDLRDRSFLEQLPACENVVFMPGLKFGSSDDWVLTFHQNAILPYLVGERYTESRIMAFSSGNPYPETSLDSGGSREEDELEPQGVYGWTVVARECSFRVTVGMYPGQQLALYRLFYAQHLCYGVLVDLAKMVKNGERISLAVPAVNLISQRDAVDIALRLLERCSDPPFVLNAAGPAVRVRAIAERMGRIMHSEPRLEGPEPEQALTGNDERCRELFGPYRDGVDEMIEAAARWVMEEQETWDKPTMFGRVDHRY